MRRLALFLLLLVSATVVHAGPVNLRWTDCWGDGGPMNMSFACDTNLGTHWMVGSFVSPQAVQGVNGNEISIDLAVAGGSLPPWWQFKNTGSCRPTSLSFSAVVPASAVNCRDWTGGAAVGGIAAYYVDFWGPGSARVLIAMAVPSASAADIVANQEYFSFVLSINHAKTVGTGACAGCDLGACIALKTIRLTTNNLTPVTLSPGTGSIGSDDRLVTWQGGAGVVSQPNPAYLNCPLATPARTSTWGAVKALYR